MTRIVIICGVLGIFTSACAASLDAQTHSPISQLPPAGESDANGVLWGTGDQAPGLTPPPGGWVADPNDRRPPGSTLMANGRSALPPGTRFNSQGTPYSTAPTGGVPVGTPGAGASISVADALRANAGVTRGTQLPVMPSEYVFGKGQVAPPRTPQIVPQITGIGIF